MISFSGSRLLAVYIIYLVFSLAIDAQEHPNKIKTSYLELYKSFQNEYGFDQELINGIFYEDQYIGAIGHPFLFENRFYQGSLLYKKKEYTDINLKYNIHEQQLIVYSTINNSNVWVILPNEFISQFSINDKLFVKLNFPEEGLKFYQLIFESEKFNCLYFWFKQKENSDHKRTVNSFKFTESKKKYYLVVENALKEYKNNTSFVKLFPPEIHSQIKEYLYAHKIKVSKNDDDTVKELMVFCNKLLYTNDDQLKINDK